MKLFKLIEKTFNGDSFLIGASLVMIGIMMFLLNCTCGT